MADEQEKKLGPNVTYQPEDENDKNPVTMQGVTFVPGKSVNLEDRLGGRAEATLKKLAGNRFFKVDGGPDHKAAAEKKAKAEEEDQKAEQEAKEQAEQQKIDNENGQVGTLRDPPDDWQGPDKAELERDSGARRPPVPKK